MASCQTRISKSKSKDQGKRRPPAAQLAVVEAARRPGAAFKLVLTVLGLWSQWFVAVCGA